MGPPPASIEPRKVVAPELSFQVKIGGFPGRLGTPAGNLRASMGFRLGSGSSEAPAAARIRLRLLGGSGGVAGF
eukprot:3041179-Alexandrium_andersonii.AAC.1